MHYLSGGLFQENKFPLKLIGPNLFFPWLLVFYYLTDAFVFVLFHIIYITSTSCMQKQSFAGKHLCWSLFFNKVAGLKACTFIKKRLQHKRFTVKFLGTPFFTEHLRWLLLSMLLFLNVSSFTSRFPHFHFFLTILLLSSFEKTLSSLYHYYYIINIIIAVRFIRIAATATTYRTAISMIVIGISALMEFMLKPKP